MAQESYALFWTVVEIGVWFGVGTRSTFGHEYALHPDDARVFNEAIGAISGETDQFMAADLLLDHEYGMFGYTLSGEFRDVLPMLTMNVDHYFDLDNDGVIDLECHGRCAQCADDAAWLVALMRSVGIPSHPVTADAAYEQGVARWYFDTWVEAKLDGSRYLCPTDKYNDIVKLSFKT